MGRSDVMPDYYYSHYYYRYYWPLFRLDVDIIRFDLCAVVFLVHRFSETVTCHNWTDDYNTRHTNIEKIYKKTSTNLQRCAQKWR